MSKTHTPKKVESRRTIVSIVDSFRENGNKLAIRHFLADKKEIKLSYDELYHKIRRMSAGMRAQGFTPGETAIISAPNSIQWIVSFFATLYSGGIAVPVDSGHDDESLEHIARDSAARWIFADEKTATRIRELIPRKHIHFVLLESERESQDDERSWQNLKDTPKEPEQVAPNDAAVLFYTSGTTGMPKGVPLSHANIMMQLDAVLVDLGLLKPKDKVLMPLPCYHVYPLDLGVLGPLRMGLEIILPHSLTGPEIMHALNAGKATVIIAVPRLLRALFNAVDSKLSATKSGAAVFHALLGFSSAVVNTTSWNVGRTIFRPIHKKFAPKLRLMCCGGAPLDPELASNLRGLGWDVAIGYGLTETAPLLTIRMPSNRDVQGVGKPVPNVDVRIAKIEDENSQPKDKREGQIEVRGPNVFSGYKDLPDKTEESFSADGWFKTGDLGFLHFGNLHVTGRASTTMVLEGGKKIQPDDIEDKFDGAPGIKEFAVLQADRKLVALVVASLKGSKEKDAEKVISETISSVSKQLPTYMRITDFAITREPLPRTSLGKVKRHELEEGYKRAKQGAEKGKKKGGGESSMSAEDKALVQEATVNEVWEWLKKRFPDGDLNLDKSPQLDLNIDSLEWMNLTLEMREVTGVELTEDAISRVETIRDLLTEVSEISKSGKLVKGSPIEQPAKFLTDEQKHWLEPLNPVMRAISTGLYGLNLGLTKLLFHIEAVGLENIPKKGNVVFTPNHSSYLDVFAICGALPLEILENTQWAGWTGIAFANPFNTFMSRLIRTIPIDAQRALISSLALGSAVLKKHRNLAWFPEGERTLDGKLLPFKPGIGMLLEKSDIDVIPVYIKGAREALPPGAFMIRPTKIQVYFGEPVKPESLEEEGKGERPSEKIASGLRSRVHKLELKANRRKSA